MANTTNFGWSTPDNTGLVKDGAKDIRTLGSAIDTSMGELLGGDTGQVLSKSSDTDMDFVWTDATEVDPATPNVAGIVLGDTVNENASYGYKAGENQTTGSTANTLIGSYAGRELTTGQAVTAVGKQAFMNSTASQTVAVGY
jgi:hypothetical protein